MYIYGSGQPYTQRTEQCTHTNSCPTQQERPTQCFPRAPAWAPATFRPASAGGTFLVLVPISLPFPLPLPLACIPSPIPIPLSIPLSVSISVPVPVSILHGIVMVSAGAHQVHTQEGRLNREQECVTAWQCKKLKQFTVPISILHGIVMLSAVMLSAGARGVGCTHKKGICIEHRSVLLHGNVKNSNSLLFLFRTCTALRCLAQGTRGGMHTGMAFLSCTDVCCFARALHRARTCAALQDLCIMYGRLLLCKSFASCTDVCCFARALHHARTFVALQELCIMHRRLLLCKTFASCTDVCCFARPLHRARMCAALQELESSLLLHRI